MEIVEINSIGKLESYKEQWNTILQQSNTDVIFLTYEYCRCWLDTYGKNREILVLLAKEGTEIIGIAPLVITTYSKLGIKTKVVEFLGTLRSDYMDFIVRRNTNNATVLRLFCSYLWSINNRWNIVSLRQVPDSSTTSSLLQDSFKEFKIPFSIQQASPCMVVQIEGCEKHIQTKINKQKTLRNCINRLKRIGNLEYGHATGVQESLSYLDSFFQQHINRWKNTATPSIFCNKLHQQFFRRVVELLSDKGVVRIAYLNLDNTPISIILGFEYNRSFYVLKTVYDPLYSNYSAGRIIVRYAVQYCLDTGLANLDLLAGTEEYKKYITNRTKQTCHILMYKSSLRKLCCQLKAVLRNSRFLSPIFKGGKIWVWRINFKKYFNRYVTFGLAKK